MSLSTCVSALTAGHLSSRSLSCFHSCLTLRLGDVRMGVYPGQLVIVVCIRGQGWSVAMIGFTNLPIDWLFSFGIRNSAANEHHFSAALVCV